VSKHSEKRQYWQYHIESYGSSKLSIKAYCTKESLNRHTFGYWLDKVGGRRRQRSSVNSKGKFLPVVVTGSVHNGFRPGRGLPDPKWVADFLKAFLERSDERHL
jgi:hypothetical protein